MISNSPSSGHALCLSPPLSEIFEDLIFPDQAFTTYGKVSAEEGCQARVDLPRQADTSQLKPENHVKVLKWCYIQANRVLWDSWEAHVHSCPDPYNSFSSGLHICCVAVAHTLHLPSNIIAGHSGVSSSHSIILYILLLPFIRCESFYVAIMPATLSHSSLKDSGVFEIMSQSHPSRQQKIWDKLGKHEINHRFYSRLLAALDLAAMENWGSFTNLCQTEGFAAGCWLKVLLLKTKVLINLGSKQFLLHILLNLTTKCSHNMQAAILTH